MSWAFILRGSHRVVARASPEEEEEEWEECLNPPPTRIMTEEGVISVPGDDGADIGKAEAREDDEEEEEPLTEVDRTLSMTMQELLELADKPPPRRIPPSLLGFLLGVAVGGVGCYLLMTHKGVGYSSCTQHRQLR